MNISKNLRTGENVIEFTPSGNDIQFSCWMGMISGLIRVVDDVGQVDVTNPDTAPPPAGTGSCCASGGSSVAPPSSIYGDDITEVPTERLVRKAIVSGGVQDAVFKGVGWEFEPLIVVVQSDQKVRLTLDLTESDPLEDTYWLISISDRNVIASFQGEKGIVETELTLTSTGGYALVKGNRVMGVLEAVSDLSEVDIEAVRKQYLVGN